MTERAHLFDTGPLLCFAAIPAGPTLLKERYGTSGHTTEHVVVELRGLRKHPNGAVARAAITALDQMGWLAVHAFDSEADYEELNLLRTQLRTFQRRPPVRADSDTGECSLILLAERLGNSASVIIINEDPARRLARARRLVSASAVDVLQALTRSGALTPTKAYQHYRTMISAGLDPGDVVSDKTYFT